MEGAGSGRGGQRSGAAGAGRAMRCRSSGTCGAG